MKRTFTLFTLLLLHFAAICQISTDELPVSFSIAADQFKAQEADLRILPRLETAKIQEEDKRDEQDGLPPRFGFPHEVNFNLNNSGVWTKLSNGDRIWQLSIHCPDAVSINLLYDQFYLPDKAKFFLYTSDQKNTIGAFTSRNNKGTAEDVQGFATGILYGETITLEYYLPKEVKEDGVISIGAVVHGYRYIDLPENSTPTLNPSGECQVNINCSEGANWQQEKNAVALILVNGNRYCSGSLINTTCNDDQPLLLTADHCLGGWANSVKHDAISSPVLNHWSFYWHYERPTCSNTGLAPPILSTSGATVVSNNAVSDFALLRLTEDPKNKNGVTPYYLGWDRSGNSGTGGVGIHHPSGDAKKISTYTITPGSTNYLSNTVNLLGNYWRVIWAATSTIHHGVTEGGSSGSALINSNKRIIGQLTGGEASCALKNSPDWYGKFSVSWTGGGATDNRRRLDHWLNPSGGTAPTTLNGKTVRRITGPDNGGCGATYSVPNLPSGSTISWSFSSNLQRVNPPGNPALTVVPINPNFSAGGWIQATVSVPDGCSYVIRKDIWVGVPGHPSPAYQSFNVHGGGTFNAPSFPGVITGYNWTVSSSLTVVNGGGTSNNTITVSLNSNQMSGDIFVKAMNSCGSSVQQAQIRVNRIQGFNFMVYPNPVAEDLHVEVIGNDSTKLIEELIDYQIQLFDENGNKFISKKAKGQKDQISVRNLKNGIYYIHILHKEGLIRKKIVVRK